MKNKTILFCFITLSMIVFKNSSAQTSIPQDSATGLYSYKGIVKVDSTTKEQLYSHSKAWILKTLKSSDNMVELEDKDFNSITGSGTVLLDKQSSGPYSYRNGKLNFKLTIQFKEGRVKYIFENFTYYGEVFVFMQTTPYKTVTSGLDELILPGNGINNVLNNINEKMKSLVNSLTIGVSAAGNNSNEDW